MVLANHFFLRGLVLLVQLSNISEMLTYEHWREILITQQTIGRLRVIFGRTQDDIKRDFIPTALINPLRCVG